MIEETDFLTDNGREKSLDDFKDFRSHLGNFDGEKRLEKILEILDKNHLDAIYIDLTTPDVEKLGLKSIKVIMPEMQIPFFPSEEFKYLGGRRLYEVPEKLGYSNRELDEDEFNQIPHPFA
jgi:ribosomal protein S12 methylthiotransferase accessory factor